MSAERKCRCGGVVMSAKHALKKEWFCYCLGCGRESSTWRRSEKEALEAYDYYEDQLPKSPPASEGSGQGALNRR